MGIMPQLGITCLRLAGRALLPREGMVKQNEDPSARVSASSRIPAIQVGCSWLSFDISNVWKLGTVSFSRCKVSNGTYKYMFYS